MYGSNKQSQGSSSTAYFIQPVRKTDDVCQPLIYYRYQGIILENTQSKRTGGQSETRVVPPMLP